eukprot:2941844-Pyramimonas_sp.AAC.1
MRSPRREGPRSHRERLRGLRRHRTRSVQLASSSASRARPGARPAFAATRRPSCAGRSTSTRKTLGRPRSPWTSAT